MHGACMSLHLCHMPGPAKTMMMKLCPCIASPLTICCHSHVNATSRTVVVTREQGKNEKLMKALGNYGISCLELPLIEHKEGPDLQKLPQSIQDADLDWIVITSPEGAAVFLDSWRFAGSPNVRIAVVGGGTKEVFESIGDDRAMLDIAFIPSKANAKVLADELPRKENGSGKVLYPASLKASGDLEKGLFERGFQVLRLNAYSTEPVKSVDPSIKTAAMSSPVVAFASPSAVLAWVGLIDVSRWCGAAACIGETSAKAARNAGMKKIFYPEFPGLDGWVNSILEALESQSFASMS